MRDDFPIYQRAFLVATVASPAAPTATEILGGVDISNNLDPEGLSLAVATETIDSTLWHSQIKTVRPTKFGWDGATLTGEREADSGLYERAIFGDAWNLVLLIGANNDDSWTDSTKSEVYGFEFGVRSVDTPRQGLPITFTVPIYIQSFAEGTIAGSLGGAASAHTLLDEDGAPLLDESGVPLLDEAA